MGKSKLLHIGLDDTDSKEGMCTTYVGAVIINELQRMGMKVLNYPRLIRLNPNWIWKTRGNCAISIRVRAQHHRIPRIKSMVLNTVQRLAELDHETTNPGVAFFEGNEVPGELKTFARRVVQDVVDIGEAEEVAREVGAEVFKFKLGRGVIGALAAIGEDLEEDKTFELIAYRVPSNWGTKRRVDGGSVIRMNDLTYPKTFDNIDLHTGEIRITPHTPCPILYGIRAEDPQVAVKAHFMVKSLEPVERWVVYETNQATDEHIKATAIHDVQLYRSHVVKGEVCQRPRIIHGGHVIFRIRDGGEIDCAAFEPTRKFRDVIMKLSVGDVVRAYGGVKPKTGLPLTINLEKVEVLQLKPHLVKANPLCPSCGKRTKSEGKGKGFQCRRCGLKLPTSSVNFREVARDIVTGVYEVPPRARRHLAKPAVRL